MTAPLLLALALALAGPPPGTDAPAAAEAGEAPSWNHGGPRHDLALGVHSTTFLSKEGSQYTFHSASLGVLLSTGDRGPFLSALLLLPLQARQDGQSYATANYYDHRSGGDVLVGAQWRSSLSAAESELGAGLHATVIYLPGKSGYRDFSALPLGIGATGALRWRTGARQFSRTVDVGAYASVAFDFYDPMRAGDLAHGFTFRAGVLVGLGERR